MRTSLLLAIAVALALPASAAAAPAKISPRAVSVSPAGLAAVEAANPNRHALRGTATATAGGRTLVRRKVRLGRLSVAIIALRFDARDLAAIRSAGARAKLTLALRRAGGPTTTTRRTLRLRLPASPQVPPSGGDPVPPPAPPPAATGRYAGRMGDEGPYDDFELTVTGGQIEITRPPTVPVFCAENGGAYRSALSFELFDVPGPWTVGADEQVARQSIAVNQLVSPGTRSITYKMTGTTQAPGRIAGTMGMSFFDSKYDVFTNTITFVNCSGSQSFEAVAA